MKYHRMSAAKAWRMPWDHFLRTSTERRAEMIAFCLAEAKVAEFEREKMKERADAECKRRESGGFDPMAAQQSMMMAR